MRVSAFLSRYMTVFTRANLAPMSVCVVCIAVGLLASYWNLPYMPITCKTNVLTDRETYDTVVRVAGAWTGAARAFKVRICVRGHLCRPTLCSKVTETHHSKMSLMFQFSRNL